MRGVGCGPYHAVSMSGVTYGLDIEFAGGDAGYGT